MNVERSEDSTYGYGYGYEKFPGALKILESNKTNRNEKDSPIQIIQETWDSGEV